MAAAASQLKPVPAGQAQPPPAQPQQALYVVRCAGLCSDEAAPHLHNLLKGMCVRRAQADENEYGLSMPLASGTKTGQFKMVKQVPVQAQPIVPLGPQQPIIWRLVHESPPLAGQPYNSLPAAVLEVTESSLSGIYSVQFMVALGCHVRYRIQRRNHVYTCLHERHEVQVSVFQVLERGKDGAGGQALFPGAAVEVRAAAGPEQQVEAAKRLGRFCQLLLPFCVAKRV